MRTVLIAILAFGLAGAAAHSQQPTVDPRVLDRAAVDPEFFELAIADPELAAVVAVAGIVLPLPDDPRLLVAIRATYPFIPPPIPNGVSTLAAGPLAPAVPHKAIGSMGTQVTLSKPDDSLQQKAAELLKLEAVPAKRVAHFNHIWKELRFLGWDVRIVDAKAVDGAAVIEVRARPFAQGSNGGEVFPAGDTIETYRLEQGKLKLLKVDTPLPVFWDMP